MPGGNSDQTTSTGASAVNAGDLGRTLVNNLNTAVTTPPSMSPETIAGLQAVSHGVQNYQPGLNNAFNNTAGLAVDGGLNNNLIPGLSDTLASLQGISTNGVSVSNGAADFNDVLNKYKSLYAQANVPTATSTWLTPTLQGLSQPSYADTQAKSLYQQTQQPSFAQQGYKDIYNQLQAPSFAEQGYQNMYNGLQGPTTTEQNLAGYANGSLINANPYLDAAIAAARGNTTGAVNASFSNSGRLGSGLNVGTLGKTLADSETGARLAQYNQDVQNQFGANAQIEAAKAGNVGLQSQALAGTDTARNNRFGLQSSALNGYDTATTSQLGRSLSALSAQDQFRLAQQNALQSATGAIDTSNNNLTNTLGNVLAGQTSAAGAKTSAAQNATALSTNAQLNAANQLIGANTAANTTALNAANSLGGQFNNALGPSLAVLGVGQYLDANNNAPVNNSLGVLQAMGGGNAQGVAAETPWWQQALGFAGQTASNALRFL